MIQFLQQQTLRFVAAVQTLHPSYRVFVVGSQADADRAAYAYLRLRNRVPDLPIVEFRLASELQNVSDEPVTGILLANPEHWNAVPPADLSSILCSVRAPLGVAVTHSFDVIADMETCMAQEDKPAEQPAEVAKPDPNEVTSHRLSDANDGLTVKRVTKTGAEGNPTMGYIISGFDTDGHPNAFTAHEGPSKSMTVLFDTGNGGVPNGVTPEALQAVILNHLQDTMSGPGSSMEVTLALVNLQQGLMWLQQATKARAEARAGAKA
jgi:hypothetical protein